MGKPKLWKDKSFPFVELLYLDNVYYKIEITNKSKIDKQKAYIKLSERTLNPPDLWRVTVYYQVFKPEDPIYMMRMPNNQNNTLYLEKYFSSAKETRIFLYKLQNNFENIRMEILL